MITEEKPLQLSGVLSIECTHGDGEIQIQVLDGIVTKVKHVYDH